MSQLKVAVIGGTGVYDQTILQEPREMTVETRYGPALMQRGLFKEREVYFLARHGTGHAVPPHLVNYRANIAALKKVGVTAVIATAAVGSLRQEMSPGSRVVLDQFIDFTKGRPSTFYDGEEGWVVHVDFTEPYCPELRDAVIRAGAALGQKVIERGCYLCAEGPRFETPAEIRMMDRWGADLVGMTNVPEVVLAREAGLCYATIALVSNYAAGISETPLTHEEVLEEVARGKNDLDNLLAASIEEIRPARSCLCRQAGEQRAWEEE